MYVAKLKTTCCITSRDKAVVKNCLSFISTKLFSREVAVNTILIINPVTEINHRKMAKDNVMLVLP